KVRQKLVGAVDGRQWPGEGRLFQIVLLWKLTAFVALDHSTSYRSPATHPVMLGGILSIMADDEPFYSPTHKPPPPRTVRRAGARIWTVQKGPVTWTCELKYHGEWGVEAMILRNGELVISQRFLLHEQASRWSEEQRHDVERGWIDA